MFGCLCACILCGIEYLSAWKRNKICLILWTGTRIFLSFIFLLSAVLTLSALESLKHVPPKVYSWPVWGAINGVYGIMNAYFAYVINAFRKSLR